MRIHDYFAALERSVRENVPAARLSWPVTSLASDEYNGFLRCRLVFWDESYLDVYEASFPW